LVSTAAAAIAGDAGGIGATVVDDEVVGAEVVGCGAGGACSALRDDDEVVDVVAGRSMVGNTVLGPVRRGGPSVGTGA
jgi:hypothetical protein